MNTSAPFKVRIWYDYFGFGVVRCANLYEISYTISLETEKSINLYEKSCTFASFAENPSIITEKSYRLNGQGLHVWSKGQSLC
jgi:hypothetical protein